MNLLDQMLELESNEHIVAAAIQLGAREIQPLSADEESLISKPLPLITPGTIKALRTSIKDGSDPLGFLFSVINSQKDRREMGAVYTPYPIIEAMVDWSANMVSQPARVVDPGTGSGRFLRAAARKFPKATLVGYEVDPIAALMARANLAVIGVSPRAQIYLEDYRKCNLQGINGSTLFLANPPYVRHHLIDQKWKTWLATQAHIFGHRASGLAGLHVYFFLATARIAKAGDVGIFITASEWLDVNYGELVRKLFLDNLGGIDINVIEPVALPFVGTATTAVISGFRVGDKPASIGVRRVADLNALGSLRTERAVHRERFEEASRWTPLTRSLENRRSDFIELGEICRVHRGQVTGANAVWIENDESKHLPTSVLFPTVTKAKELFLAGGALTDAKGLRRVIDIPPDLLFFEDEERERITEYLKLAKKRGANSGYVASHRRAWWSVGLKAPAPILATYMARRPPAFVRNLVKARHINIAHGLYPRTPLDSKVLDRLASFLSLGVSTAQGRTYAGGLTKFEPKEMERLPVPDLDLLRDNVSLEELLN
jgi:adenine-specific DNA-methyltransferase